MRKFPHHGLADQEVEHLAAELWGLEDEGRSDLGDLPESVVDLPRLLERLAARGLAEIAGARATLTPTGRALAEKVVRRHRLAEILFSTVLDVKDDRTVNRTACVMEHVLSAEVTESVCSFLGHPKSCPHGKPIPAGRCCRSFSDRVAPLIQPLSRLALGESARIAYIVPKDPERLVRLSGLGVIPGATLRLRQKRPAAVVSIGETTLAVDSDIADEIFVKRVG